MGGGAAGLERSSRGALEEDEADVAGLEGRALVVVQVVLEVPVPDAELFAGPPHESRRWFGAKSPFRGKREKKRVGESSEHWCLAKVKEACLD